MKRLAMTALVILIAMSAFAKDPEPYLQFAKMPFYPGLARAARIEGEVKIHFVVNDKGEPEEVKAVSGHPILKQDAIDNVKAWRFAWPTPCACRVKQEATLVYKLSNEVAEPDSRRVSVTWYDKNRLVIETDPLPIETVTTD
jgi:TonB family protein